MNQCQTIEYESAPGRTRRGAHPAARRSPPLQMARQVGNRAFATHVARPHAQMGNASLARYMQGDEGHGGIETEALAKAGFTPQQVKSTYFGNWLRDFSQIHPDSPRPEGLMLLLNILALGEFGHELTDEELGTYVPSEHLDNPEGGGTVEDPRIQMYEHAAPGSANRKKYDDAYARLSPAQREAYDAERANKVAIEDKAQADGLPPYIEEGKVHAKEEFSQAVKNGDPDGLPMLGNGLHVVEDYFSHSNFTEACIVTLDKAGDPAIKPLMDRLLQTHLGQNLAMLVPEDPATKKIKIQTGTYAHGANDEVSKLEALESQLASGELLKTFIKGSILKLHLTTDELVKKVAGPVGTVLGAGVELFEKVAKIGLNPLGPLVDGTANVNPPSGGESSGETRKVVSEITELYAMEVGEAVDMLIEVVGAEALMGILAIAEPSLAVYIDASKKSEEKTNESGGEARQAGLSGPTHSEIAKDDPKDLLYPASKALAVFADTEIGKTIKPELKPSAELKAGAKGGAPEGGATPGGEGAQPGGPAPAGGPEGAQAGGPAPAGTASPPGAATPEGAASAGKTPPAGAAPEGAQAGSPSEQLVDKFVANPANDPWWEAPLKAAAAEK